MKTKKTKILMNFKNTMRGAEGGAIFALKISHIFPQGGP